MPASQYQDKDPSIHIAFDLLFHEGIYIEPDLLKTGRL